jgi:hypothetical protein
MAYYEAVAQLIPLLLLTLVIEHRVLQPLPEFRSRRSLEGAIRVFTALTACAFVLAEAQVLWILRHGRARPEMHDDIRAALVLGAAAIVLPIAVRAVTWLRSSGVRGAVTSLVAGFALFATLWVTAGLATR